MKDLGEIGKGEERGFRKGAERVVVDPRVFFEDSGNTVIHPTIHELGHSSHTLFLIPPTLKEGVACEQSRTLFWIHTWRG